MNIEGRIIAEEMLVALHLLPRTPVVRAVVVAPSPATESYLSIKQRQAERAGMHLEIKRLLDTSNTEDVIAAVEAPGCDALIVQLPLPPALDAKAILNSIPLGKDADVLSDYAYAQFLEGAPGALIPPVADAVAEILARAGVTVSGKRAIVVGHGRLVGMPTAAWLTREGAEVSVVTKESGDLSILKDADIVVSGAGSPDVVTPELLKDGVVLIDAGTSEQGGAIVGDADPACADVASVFTPVPGGVGPVSVACLFRNVGKLLTRALQEDVKPVD